MEINESPPVSLADRRKVNFGELTAQAQEIYIGELLEQFRLGMLSLDQAKKLISDLTNDALTRESMTKLHDKNGLMLRLREAVIVAKENNQPLTVLYFDGDKFKDINDKFSHARGDEVIIAMAEALKASLRHTDPIARLDQSDLEEQHEKLEFEAQEARPGGDEFVVVLLGANLDKGQEIGQKVCQIVAEHVNQQFPDMAARLGHDFSVSFGAAEYKPGMDPEQLLDEADQQLHQAKESRGVARA